MEFPPNADWDAIKLMFIFLVVMVPLGFMIERYEDSREDKNNK